MSAIDRFKSIITNCKSNPGNPVNYMRVNRLNNLFSSALYIPRESEEVFLKTYGDAVFKEGFNHKDYLCINQKPEDLRPFIVDMDTCNEYEAMELSLDDPEPAPDDEIYRIFTAPQINKILEYVRTTLLEFYGDSLPDKTYEMFIMPKNPLGITRTNDKVTVKDGLHLVMPNLVGFADTIQAIYEKLQQLLASGPLNQLTGGKSPIDFKYSSKSGMPWMLYGCSKDGYGAYRISKIVDIRTLNEINPGIPAEELPLYLSIRGKTAETPLLKPVPRKQEKPIQKKISANYSGITGSTFDYVRKCLDLLPEKYSNEYQLWASIGLKLASATNHAPEAYEIWIDFSKKCPEKFDEDHCARIWNSARDGYCTLGAIYKIAREESPKEYAEIMKSNVMDKILAINRQFADAELADILVTVLNGEYVVTHEGRSATVYRFVNHIWKKMPSANALEVHCQNILRQLFLDAEQILLDRRRVSTREIDKNVKDRSDHIWKQGIRILNSAPMANIMKSLIKKLTDDEFIDKLNQNMYLFAFRNGIYDLRTGEFRDGKPSDMISVQSPVDYVKYNANTEEAGELLRILRDIMPDDMTFNFFMDFCAFCLKGNVSDNRFLVLYGGGGNGKSALVNFISRGFGRHQYYTPVDVKLFTGRQKAAGDANPEKVKLKYKNIGITTEIDERAVLNESELKDATGCNPISGRDLFIGASQSDFDPRHHLMFQVNHITAFNSTDYSFLRRIRILNFPNVFVDNPTAPHERKIDSFLAEKIQVLAPIFMAYLVHRYETNIAPNKHYLNDIPEIVNYTRTMIKSNNLFLVFISGILVKTKSKSDIVSIDSIYEKYKTWYDTSGLYRGSRMDKLRFKRELSVQYRGFVKENTITHHVINEELESEEYSLD